MGAPPRDVSRFKGSAGSRQSRLYAEKAGVFGFLYSVMAPMYLSWLICQSQFGTICYGLLVVDHVHIVPVVSVGPALTSARTNKPAQRTLGVSARIVPNVRTEKPVS